MGALTKQQAISLKLAQWLGKERAHLAFDKDGKPEIVFLLNGYHWERFNPFYTASESLAQAHECIFTALERRIQIDFYPDFVRVCNHNAGPMYQIYTVPHGEGIEARSATTLEAIYYAVGGTAEEWEK